MTIEQTKPIRKFARDAIAFFFWAHAFFATHLVHLPVSWQFHSPTWAYTTLLLLTICFYSLLGKYEWFSVLADCFYVYLWPCIAIVRICWAAIKIFYKYLRARVIIKSPELIIRPTPPRPSPTAPQNESKEKIEKRSALAWAVKPFMEFSILWSLLILVSAEKFFIVLASLVALFCSVRAIYELWEFTADASSWIEKLKGTFATQIASHIGQIRAWEEMSNLEEVTKAANALKNA